MAMTTQTRQPQRGLTFDDVWAALMETERQLNELKYGLDMDRDDPLDKLIKRITTRSILLKFKALGFDFDDALRYVEICEHGTKRVVESIDCLLLNADFALVVDVTNGKAKGDVDRHLTRMKTLSGKQNGVLAGKKLYGAVAGIKMTRKTRDYAKQRGFFVLEPSGDSVKIEAPEGKPAVW